MNEAKDFLRDELADAPRSVPDIKKAAVAAGLSWRTVERAKADLKVRSSKGGINEGWLWELPKAAKDPHEDRHS